MKYSRPGLVPVSDAVQILIDTMIGAGLEPGLVVTLVSNATMQMAAVKPTRSLHAEAQARYKAKKGALKPPISADHNDHSLITADSHNDRSEIAFDALARLRFYLLLFLRNLG